MKRENLDYNIIKPCRCGCGNLIIIRAHHKYRGIPDYMPGHNNNGKKIKYRKRSPCKEETKLKISRALMGHPVSEESIQKAKEKNKGRKQTEESNKKRSDKLTGIPKSEATKEKIRQSHLGKKMPKECNERNSEAKKKNWQDPEYVYKQMRSRSVKQNKKEKMLEDILNEFCPGEWEYVGRGECVIGGKCPDFVNIKGQKKLIELFGDYWHKGQNPEDRKNIFRKFGYETLVIWEHELKDMDFVEFQIKEFTCQ